MVGEGAAGVSRVMYDRGLNVEGRRSQGLGLLGSRRRMGARPSGWVGDSIRKKYDEKRRQVSGTRSEENVSTTGEMCCSGSTPGAMAGLGRGGGGRAA